MIIDKGGKGLDVDELMEALKTIELLGTAKARTGAEGGASQEEPEVIRRLKETRVRLKPKKRKEHWKRKLMKRRAKGRRDDQIIRTRRKAEWAQRLSDPNDAKAWFDWLARKSNNGWTKRKGWEITFKDFEEYVWPKLKGRVPTTHRIDTKKNWTLQNVRWYDNETRELLADGSELYMTKRGYTVAETNECEEKGYTAEHEKAPAYPLDADADEGWMK